MAKKSQQNIVQAAKLKIPKAEFEQELTACIEKAEGILNITVTPIYESPSRLPYGYGAHLRKYQYNEEEFEAFKKEYRSWIDYSSELLKQAFDIPNNEYQRDFVNRGQGLYFSSNEDWVKEYKDEIRQKRDYLESLLNKLKLIPSLVKEESHKPEIKDNLKSKRVFIVHGHDEAKRLDAELMIKQLGYEPIVLFKQANQGATIIEKLEKETDDIAFAIVLYTKCDEGKAIGEQEYRPRARQNVVFEHGMMCGLLGRKKVVALLETGVEYPGDLSGIIYIDIDSAGAWKLLVAKEMKAAGLDIDINKLI